MHIGKVINFVDSRLLNIKLPSEIKRSPRALMDRKHYKANEFRTIMYYLSYTLFKGLLPDK